MKKSSQKDIKKDRGGYFTVEASLIVPFVLFCMAAVVGSMLYLLDLSTVRGLLNQEVVQISDVVKTNGRADSGKLKKEELSERSILYLLKQKYPEQEREGKKRLKEKLKKRILVLSVDQTEIKVSQIKVTGTVCVSYRIPVPVIGNLIGPVWKNRLTVSIRNGNNAEQMRRYSQFE